MHNLIVKNVVIGRMSAEAENELDCWLQEVRGGQMAGRALLPSAPLPLACYKFQLALPLSDALQKL
jgi:hypothetical protein